MGAAYDVARNRLLIFGGKGGQTYKDTWALPLEGTTSWTQIPTQGAPPWQPQYPALVYDSAHDRLLVFGGRDSSGTLRNSIWSLTLGGSPTWSVLGVSGTPPTPRDASGALYDSVRDRMLIFAGAVDYEFGQMSTNEIWELDLAGVPAWSQLSPSGGPPVGRWYPSLAYDSVLDRMLNYGGEGAGWSTDLWACSLTGSPAWSLISSPPRPRYTSAIALDPVRDRVIMFGGYPGTGALGDLWEMRFSGDTPFWSALPTLGNLPSPRWGHSMTYDPVRDRMILFGGRSGLDFRGDTWALALGGEPAWSRLVDRDTIPRTLHTAIYDPLRDRMIVFGGEQPWDPIVPSVLNDTWALALGGANPSWTNLSPAGPTPAARRYHTAIYDPVRDRMVAFGGYTANSSYLGDTWELTLGGTPAWAALAPSGGAPSPRYGATAVYDRVRDRMVLFGGSPGLYSNETWALALTSGPTWSQLAPTGGPPTARSLHSALYDPSRDRMFVTGGSGNVFRPGDGWGLTWGAPVLASLECPPDTSASPGGSSTLSWSLMNPDPFDQHIDYTLETSRDWPGFPITGTALLPAGASSQLAITIPIPDTAAAGTSALSLRTTLRAVLQSASCNRVLVVNSSAGVPTSPISLALLGAVPNPSSGNLRVAFTLPDAAPATIEAFDIGGRRLIAQDVGLLGAGRHTLRLNTPRKLSVGIYFLRLSHGSQSLTARALVIR